MRELTFRAWDKENNCWYYLHLNQMWSEQDLEFHKKVTVSGEKLYQATGLKDKHKKMIWEGDIVEYVEEYIQEDLIKKSKGVVEYHGSSFTIDGRGTLDDWGGDGNLEIIGNKYEDELKN